MHNLNKAGGQHAHKNNVNHPQTKGLFSGLLFLPKWTKSVLAPIALLLFSTLSSCSVIGDIFQAGMGVGIFLVIIVIAVIVLLVVKMGKK